jgi:hypothetical protein
LVLSCEGFEVWNNGLRVLKVWSFRVVGLLGVRVVRVSEFSEFRVFRV